MNGKVANTALRVFLCIGLMILGGCTTIGTLSADRVERFMYEDCNGEVPQSWPRLYAGSSIDIWCVVSTLRHSPEAFQGGFFCLLDVPLSAVADTIVLPYTLYSQVRFGNFRPRFVPSDDPVEMAKVESCRKIRVESCARVRAAERPLERDVEQCQREEELGAEGSVPPRQ